MKHVDVRYAAYAGAVPPRQIRMKAGGWGGSVEGMVDGSQPQPWHCLPFVEASVYGLELVYPFNTECHVVNDGGAVRFDFDYTKEPGGVLTGGEFITFNPKDRPKFYLFNTRLDIVAPPRHVIRTEPHPRFFTDDTGTVPLSMIGHVHSEWYSRKLFVVFKVPPPGTRHIFRKGEPYAQVVFVPQRVSYRLTPLGPEEEVQRRNLEEAIDGTRSHIADNVWHNPDGSEFNNHYKILSRSFGDDGLAGVRRVVELATEKKKAGLPLDKSVAECVAIANNLVSKQEFEQARAIFTHVLENDPHNAAALSGMGVCVGCTGAPLSGIDLMRQAIALRPDVATFHSNLGQMLLLTNRYAEAVASYRNAMQLTPSDAALMSHVGLLTARLGKLAEGLDLCQRAAVIDPRCAIAHYRAGSILAHLHRHEESLAAHQAALSIDPSFDPARLALANAGKQPNS